LTDFPILLSAFSGAGVVVGVVVGQSGPIHGIVGGVKTVVVTCKGAGLVVVVVVVVVGVVTEVDVSVPEDPTTMSSMAIASSVFPPQKAKNMNYDIIDK
jgi:hypothetical protein